MAANARTVADTIVDACYSWGPNDEECEIAIKEVYMCAGSGFKHDSWDCIRQECGFGWAICKGDGWCANDHRAFVNTEIIQMHHYINF